MNGRQNGALAQQAVGAFGPRVERRAGDGEDIAALLAGKAGRDRPQVDLLEHLGVRPGGKILIPLNGSYATRMARLARLLDEALG